MSDRRKHILNVLFDVKPVNHRGDLDIEKIKQMSAVIDLRKTKAIRINEDQPEIEEPLIEEPLADQAELPDQDTLLAELEGFDNLDKYLEKVQLSSVEKWEVPTQVRRSGTDSDQSIGGRDPDPKGIGKDLEQFYFPEAASQDYQLAAQPAVQEPASLKNDFDFKSLTRFLVAGFLIAMVVPAAVWVDKGFGIKENVMSNSLAAYQNLLAAKASLEEADWQTAGENFSSAQSDFIKARQEVNKLSKLTLAILGQIPGGSVVSSGIHLVKVGESLAQAGQTLTSAIGLFSFDNLFNSINLSDGSQPLSQKIALNQDNLVKALTDIRLASQELDQVKIEALPEEIQTGAVSLKKKLPLVEEILAQAIDYSDALLKILGHDNPRQYLLIFQNNSEIRATGGFIGTYGLLKLDQGRIANLMVDGVFNVDGQLHEKIIPPQPIQKVSTAWSMHDANWFPDFPTSAQKISWFYEKTGGPTTDGVISLTPTVVERLLRLTGPIAMSQYEVILDSNNFVELVQYKVEVDYDKELNRPKQILADFAPKFIETLSQLSPEKRAEVVEIILDSFKEKHILIYFRDSALQGIVVDEGWAGQLLTTSRDYLSVVSSNINGYKTDRVVQETIKHQAEIQADGSIIDTLTIIRQHQGGKEKYDWWNRVNSNYLRVYLPRGSQLISAKGQSVEIYQPPIDYQQQGFKQDPLVSSIEDKMTIDLKTGTRIFEENGKTVFANWVYVSPGETVTLVYKYKLPFKIDLTNPSDSYSLLAQKQAGSLGSQFSHQLKFPEDWSVSWQYPDENKAEAGLWRTETDLQADRLLGITFELW
ncbi:MAG: hypothetical protein CMI55_02440 [Parcubacteria group bacterium]|jgi:hypothetical protein|nr:hypothetical protein [Parcubacteria group bacterium]